MSPDALNIASVIASFLCAVAVLYFVHPHLWDLQCLGGGTGICFTWSLLLLFAPAAAGLYYPVVAYPRALGAAAVASLCAFVAVERSVFGRDPWTGEYDYYSPAWLVLIAQTTVLACTRDIAARARL